MRRSVCSFNEKNERYLRQKDPCGETCSEEASKKVRRMLSMLSTSQREVVFLYMLEEMPIEEIAKELCVSKQTVYSRIHSAKKRLKENAAFFK